jgi:Acetyltransferase (GNAT) domain
LFDEATPEQLVGIDLFIAEPSCRGVGLGRQIIRRFIAKQLYRFKAVVVDPQIGNEQAIACYQKAGFVPTQYSEDANYLLMINMLSYRGSPVNAKEQASVRPFEHYVFVRPTSFRPHKQINENLRIHFQDLYEELIHDVYRNQIDL